MISFRWGSVSGSVSGCCNLHSATCLSRAMMSMSNLSDSDMSDTLRAAFFILFLFELFLFVPANHCRRPSLFARSCFGLSGPGFTAEPSDYSGCLVHGHKHCATTCACQLEMVFFSDSCRHHRSKWNSWVQTCWVSPTALKSGTLIALSWSANWISLCPSF